jgi:hypothetical protein
MPVPKAGRKRQANTTEEPKYSGRDLRDIVETALEVELFAAQHGDKGKKLAEFGTALRKRGIEGSDNVLKARLLEVLASNQDRFLNHE